MKLHTLRFVGEKTTTLFWSHVTNFSHTIVVTYVLRWAMYRLSHFKHWFYCAEGNWQPTCCESQQLLQSYLGPPGCLSNKCPNCLFTNKHLRTVYTKINLFSNNMTSKVSPLHQILFKGIKDKGVKCKPKASVFNFNLEKNSFHLTVLCWDVF